MRGATWIAVLLATSCAGGRSAPGGGGDVPAGRGGLDTDRWKLQVPGPKDIKPGELGGYASRYFHGDPRCGGAVFWLDSADKGHTENTKYVRSELREMMDPRDNRVNWGLQGTHALSAELQMRPTPSTPAQVTVLQIHGVTDAGGNAPPLLKVAMRKGDLWALLKTDATGEAEDKILLERGLGNQRFRADVWVKDGKLRVAVNGVKKLDRDVSFWPYKNYFKAGVYPQATQGITEVCFHRLGTKHELAGE